VQDVRAVTGDDVVMTQWEIEKARRRALRERRTQLTELNRITTARFEECGRAGGHAPSGEWIERDGFALGICGACGVPIPPRGWGNRASSSKGGKTAKLARSDGEWPRRRVTSQRF
jgi:hypothetical protein